MDPDSQAKAVRTSSRLRQSLVRVLVVVVVSVIASWILHAHPEARASGTHRAGFGLGIWHGATMPLALPKLLLGQEATIYAPVNIGRVYDIGYILGVNLCGLLFFGAFFWRLRRWQSAWRGASKGERLDQ